MTESSPVSHISPNENIIVASCGKLIPNMEARIVSVDTKQDLEIGEEGEIWMKGCGATFRRSNLFVLH